MVAKRLASTLWSETEKGKREEGKLQNLPKSLISLPPERAAEGGDRWSIPSGAKRACANRPSPRRWKKRKEWGERGKINKKEETGGSALDEKWGRGIRLWVRGTRLGEINYFGGKKKGKKGNREKETGLDRGGGWWNHFSWRWRG